MVDRWSPTADRPISGPGSAAARQSTAIRHGRAQCATYCIRWIDGFHAAFGFWSDGREPVELQTARGRRLCLQRRASRYSWHRGHRPEAGILVEYVRELADPATKEWERTAPGHALADGLAGLELLAPPVWHRAPEAPPAELTKIEAEPDRASLLEAAE